MNNEHKMVMDIARTKAYAALEALEKLSKPALQAVLKAHEIGNDRPIKRYLRILNEDPQVASVEQPRYYIVVTKKFSDEFHTYRAGERILTKNGKVRSFSDRRRAISFMHRHLQGMTEDLGLIVTSKPERWGSQAD